jgi:hypothetical protein
MTKPTGRPRGRPKTKEYVTLMARVDVALADQVKRYAALHRQPISSVIRDALALLMEEYPAEADRTGSHRLAAHEFLSDRYESPLDTLVGETDSAGLQAFMSDINEDGRIMSDINEEAGIVSDINRGATAEKLSNTHPVAPVADRHAVSALPTPYDPAVAVARIQGLKAQGQSLRQIAAQLTADGAPTRRGRPWDQSSVRYLLETYGG